MNRIVRKIGYGLLISTLSGLAACSTSEAEEGSPYRLVTTPGPRGTTRLVEVEPPPQASAEAQPCPRETVQSNRPKYRLVSTPGPRGTIRAVRVRGAEAPCR